jgi:pimeloyl-ACP methyl ester carboxylesterase
MAMRATIDDGVEELGDLLDHLESCGIDTARVLVCGHCMGGAIAARWVARNPGRCAALVLESTGFFSDPSLRRKADIIIQPWDRLPESLRKTLIGMHGPLKAPEVWNFILAWEDDYIMHPAYDLRPDLAAIDCPVLVATGERDVYFKPEHTRHGHAVLAGRGALAAGHADRCGPGAELWIPEGIGHDLHHELPDEFAGRLAGFLGA